MLKLGVWKPEQFYSDPPRGLQRSLYYRLSRSRVSLQLLRESERASSGIALFERLMPHVQLSNGIWRTTFEQRFLQLDLEVNRVLRECFSPQQPITVEDWAASTCLTSCEWAESLFPIFPRLHFAASDRELFFVEVEQKNSGEIFVAEPDGRPLQYIRPPLVIRMQPPEPWLLPINRLFYLRALRRWRPAAKTWPLPDTWLADASSAAPLDRSVYRFRKLPLIHPRALILARTDTRFSIRRHSVFDAAPSRCHAIRSMNILNKAYFSDSHITAAARCVIDSLHPGGIWIVGRTIRDNPSAHDVSIFRKPPSGAIEVIAQIGAGSEIQDIVLGAGGR
jgi:hypothetical protein